MSNPTKDEQIKALVSTIADRDEWIVKLDGKNLELNQTVNELSQQCDDFEHTISLLRKEITVLKRLSCNK